MREKILISAEPGVCRPLGHARGRIVRRGVRRPSRQPGCRAYRSRAGPQHKLTTLRDSAFPGRAGARSPWAGHGCRTARFVPGLRRRLPGRQAERFGMDPMVMLGQDLAEAARSVGDRAAADLAARDRKMGNGHGETAGIRLAHRFHDASPARLTLRPPRACRERTWMCSWVLSAGLMASVATKRTRPWAKSGACGRAASQMASRRAVR
jgi:hypothetical protein